MKVTINIEAAIGGMKVGDSFFVPCIPCTDVDSRARKCADEYKVTVCVRKWRQNGVKGLRIWRTM